MKRLAIIGSGDLGQQIAYHALHDRHYQPVGFFDDFQPVGTIKHGLPILGGTEEIVLKFKEGCFDYLMVGIGYRHLKLRKMIYEQLAPIVPFGTIVHSSCYVDESCKIGKGVVLYPGCVLDMNVVVEDNVLLNTGCVIAHDSIIGTACFLSPAVKVAGFVKIGSESTLGIGSIVIDNITIGSCIRTGAGAVVVDNLEKPGLYLGVPAVLRKEYNF